MRIRLLSIAVVLALAACRDSGPAGPRVDPTAPFEVARDAFAELAGIVEVSGDDLAPVYLRIGNDRIALQGGEAWNLLRLEGAEVRVRGSMDGAATMFVKDFLTLRVKGRAVYDGIVAMTDDGLALRLADGTIFMLLDAPEGVAQRVGVRIWFAPREADSPAQFGIIAG